MKQKKRILAALMIFLALGILAQCGLLFLGYFDKDDKAEVAQLPPAPTPIIIATPTPTPEPTPEPTPTPFPEYDIQLMAVGDDLHHVGVILTSKKSDGTFDMDFLFDSIQDMLDVSDIKCINQETIMAGDNLPMNGYPRFNSPFATADSIAKAGFNVVCHATNHANDMGLDGLLTTWNYWKDNYPEVNVVGIHSDTEESRITYMEVKGIKFALLNYTYSANSATLDKRLLGHLDWLCEYDRDSYLLNLEKMGAWVEEDIAEAKENSDFVIVFPHWGNEYQTKPSYYEQVFAKQIVEAGADLIIGTHPHVPQPVEWIEADNGNRALCYYSLGNYVSTQIEPVTMLEEMAIVNIHVDENGPSINEEKTGVIPLVNQYTKKPVRTKDIYYLEDYTEELALEHGIWTYYGGHSFHLDDLLKWSDEIFGDWILTKEQVLNFKNEE